MAFPNPADFVRGRTIDGYDVLLDWRFVYRVEMQESRIYVYVGHPGRADYAGYEFGMRGGIEILDRLRRDAEREA